ncbi:MAG: DUF4830 domain-containing protein [Oscillospiraceae bacterium]|nr:DUF4830 domain-containing protein [Oscillospiraceae bacterium]
MLVMTAKVDKKKIAVIFAAVVVAIAALILLFSGGRDASPTAATNVSNNDARVEFLKGFGWDVTTSPVESSQVRIPEKTNEVFDRYNEMQKQQGYDLTQYAGKTVMRYVYKINNYPGAIEPVYATVLIYKNQVIGGDVTDTAAKGHIHGFQKPEQLPQSTTPATDATAPTATSPTGVTE